MTSGGSRQRQETRAGWLDAQELGRAGTGFAELATALVRRRELNRAVAAASGKQRRRKETNGDGTSYIRWPGSKRKLQRSLSRASAKLRTATRMLGTEKKAAGDELASVATVHQNYQIATRFKTQITPKFM